MAELGTRSNVFQFLLLVGFFQAGTEGLLPESLGGLEQNTNVLGTLWLCIC